MINKVSSALSEATSGGVERRGFRWRFDPQFGSVFNQLLDKVKPKDKKIQDNEVTIQQYLNGQVQVSGRPVNTFYSYRFRGLNHDTGAPEFYGAIEKEPMLDKNGDPVYDENGDPVIINNAEIYSNMD